MIVRRFAPADTDTIISLFRETVRTVNLGDYTEAQVAAWAPDAIDRAAWLERLTGNDSYVAVADDMIAGFAELEPDGRINMMFVHKDHQRRGVASALLRRIEDRASKLRLGRLRTEASITARPFFERHGYIVLEEQTVVRRSGQSLPNYRMERLLTEAGEAG